LQEHGHKRLSFQLRSVPHFHKESRDDIVQDVLLTFHRVYSLYATKNTNILKNKV